MRVTLWAGGEARGIHMQRLLVKWQATLAAANIRQIAILTLKTIGILGVALFSRSSDIRPPKSPVCRLTRQNETHMQSPTIRQSCRRHQFSHPSHTRSTRLNVEAELATHWLKSSPLNRLTWSWICAVHLRNPIPHQRSQGRRPSPVKRSHLPWRPYAYFSSTSYFYN